MEEKEMTVEETAAEEKNEENTTANMATRMSVCLKMSCDRMRSKRSKRDLFLLLICA